MVHGLGDSDLTINEADVAALLQAKAAIAAGIQTLLDRLGVHNTITCGLLPGFDPRQVRLAGNTSLTGAYLTQLDRGVVDELETVRRRLEVIELNLDPDFESRFIDQLLLPSAP